MGRRDRKHTGPSRLVPYLPGESGGDRHFRRLSAALKHEEVIRERAALSGLYLSIQNDGQHWKFMQSPDFIAEWWPSSAKLVINKQYGSGVHCHDWQQVFIEIDVALKEDT